MIQVCSQCGTRWNVRDRQRSWCPRCGGSLLAPAVSSPHSQWGPPPAAPPTSAGQAPSATAQRPPQLAPGYRWVALRPGAPPYQRRQRRPLGPTPHYRTIPSWGLHQQFDVDDQSQTTTDDSSVGAVRLMLVAAMVLLGIAAFAHLVRYALLLINRSVLLHPLIAIGGVVIGLLASVLALAGVVMTVVVLVRWLIARRAAGYAAHGEADPRSTTTLWVCCLLPGVNLVMAPVFVWELAALEGRLSHLRRTIVVWWIVWVLTAVVATWSVVSTAYVTFFNNTPQNIADNTVTTIVGYLLAMAAFLLTAKVFAGFEGSSGTTAQRSVRRWVVVEQDSPKAEAEAVDPSQNREDAPESAVPVEPQGQNPAA
ncbi:hypothetical protein A5731_03295 [Mycolicibacterium conceptionense]|uniref:DUF4328 domain-containing protein n=2 Tax=Mycolicibacterium TaxID=1866885 RepID=A0A1A1YBR7_9MYCO|nr:MULTISPECIES: DUF4328 domain-containing protein [Mycolicibacterium]MCW1824893.1 DUF4328 domain-containing protein [Mycolicibacterium senegalense]OBB10002.1 hypothetical protein A5718_08665 [Mycolicibacterium conceptionense]OBF09047.1 hypothetical protein A5731_03295 [Mycolicibacterium conceptionense]OBF28751.1 hypothetical protein A5726_02150 [Mycolicibacterium conceptionense]OBF39675.1 hypothetical protein A5720_00165 [Mycolicibacterium conceptionense]